MDRRHSPTLRTPETTRLAYAEAAGRLFFDLDDTRPRPDPLDVASLLADGLAEGDIIAAAEARGMPQPKMAITLETVDLMLPYCLQLSDTIAKNNPTAIKLFAARDADVLHDIFAITHPEQTSYLFPASIAFFDFSRGIIDDAAASAFLAKFGIDESITTAGQESHVVIDTGFEGSVAKHLDKVIQRIYGVSVLEDNTLALRLVCKSPAPWAIGQAILEFAADGVFPRSESNEYRNPVRFARNLAIAMQLMPRYHPTFRDFRIDSQGTIHYSYYEGERVEIDVDGVPGNNASIVNPLAAAIIQFRTVQFALHTAEQRKQSNG